MDSYITAALIAGFFAIVVACIQARSNRQVAKKVTEVHDEVRTNHGVRQGQRIEDLGVDVAWIRGQMVTKQELADHAAHDVTVASHLAETVETTKQELLAAIRGGTEKQ